MIAIIFLCIMKSHLFAMFVWNFTTTSLPIAEILLFIKDGRKLPSPTLPITVTLCQYWHQRLGNFCTSKNKMVISGEDQMLINVLQHAVDFEIWGRLQERVYRSRIRDVNHLMERLIEEWYDSDHNIICAAVNQWRTRLRVCWWRALWTSVVTATATVTVSFELIPTVSIVLETCVFNVSYKR